MYMLFWPLADKTNFYNIFPLVFHSFMKVFLISKLLKKFTIFPMAMAITSSMQDGAEVSIVDVQYGAKILSALI